MRLLRGFTLIELLVVISIIAVLAATAVVFYNKSQEGARFSRALEDMRAIANAAEIDNDQNNGYALDFTPPRFAGEAGDLMPRWPTPPCSGWLYDWEHWSSGTIIQISIRKGSGQLVSYYYCIYGACAGEQDIKTVTDRRLVCS